MIVSLLNKKYFLSCTYLYTCSAGQIIPKNQQCVKVRLTRNTKKGQN